MLDLLACCFVCWNKSPIGWYVWLLVFEYVLVSLLLVHDNDDRDSDADVNDPVNNDEDRRALLPASLFATNLPKWVEQLLMTFIVCG